VAWWDSLAAAAPAPVKDLAVTAASSQLLLRRRGGDYRRWRADHRAWRRQPRAALLAVQRRRLDELLQFARDHSPFYRRRLAGLDLADLARLPVLEKSDLLERIDEIVVGDKRRLVASFTGGTTGAAITVYNGWPCFHERAALMDLFWEMHGFRVGRARTAWLSGRQLVWDADVRAVRFWRTNWLYRIRYYSTFHMAPEHLGRYLDDLNRFAPAFLTGFPSAIGELARFAEATGTRLTFRPRAIFVTSETLLPEQREAMERVFGCPVRNQYAASEGAPFIVECAEGRLHMDLTTGVFEVQDDGEVLVTAFATRETPIIRYRIGDRIRMAPDVPCPCGWDTPLVESIEGRSTEYVEVPGRGRIFCSQIGDCVKGVSTVLRFQVGMVDGRLAVDMVARQADFEARDKATFLAKVAERFGPVPVDIRYVDDIPRSRGGKHSVVRR
jgi:phenylacetate-CoA ligase